VPLAKIRPSPENNQLYKPVSSRDPDIRALAKDIEWDGVLEPLVLSLDNYILSGHRRYVAAKLARLVTVPCRYENVRRGDPEFLDWLRRYNMQRVKGPDEILREEIVALDPEEAHRTLDAERRKRARVSVETIELKDARRRAAISEAKRPFLETITRVLDERRDYLPLTDRQIHYALLNDPPLIHASKPDSTYTNTRAAYQSLCELLTRARLTNCIPFDAIFDPTRPVTTWQVWPSPTPFIRSQLDSLLKDYYRDLMQSQPNQVELIGEKNTIANIIEPVAMKYCIPLTIGRGYCSLPPRKAMADRFRAGGKEKLVLLVLSDFDPEGEDIAESYARSMRDDFGINNILPVKVALTRQQVAEMDLPPQMKAKEGSSRRKGFVEKHGDDVFELEAIPPDRLQEILREVIDKVLDLQAWNAEVERERQDAADLHVSRLRLAKYAESSLPDGAQGRTKR
jgi:hypothetical protein